MPNASASMKCLWRCGPSKTKVMYRYPYPLYRLNPYHSYTISYFNGTRD